MSTSNNLSYDMWVALPDEVSEDRYFKLQKLIRQKYVEDSELGIGKSERNRKNEERREKYIMLLAEDHQHHADSLARTYNVSDLDFLPENSWFLQLRFKLETPLICKDDETFYIHDNPFHKDKVFKVPFYPASAWKGRLRWMAYKQWVEGGGDAQQRLDLSLLFGDETGEEEDQKLAAYLDQSHPATKEKYRSLVQDFFRSENVKSEDVEEIGLLPHHAGWLRFYPSFFGKMDLEVINPHSRKTKAGINPIMIETVLAGETGTFALLFSPMGVTACKCSPEMMVRQLELIIGALDDLFRVYGFGAKTSSGFGAVSEITDCQLTAKNSGFQQKKNDLVRPKDEYAKYFDVNGVIRPEYCGTGDGGLLSNNEYKNSIASKADSDSLSFFKKFRNWYKEFGEDYQKQQSSDQESFPGWDANNFEEFLALPQKVRKDLGLSEGGDSGNA